MDFNNSEGRWKEMLTPAEKFNILVNESKKVPATSANIDINVKPPWFNQERYERAQIIVSEVHYPSISISSLTGLLITVQTPDVLKALLRTGKSRTIPYLLNRYADTIKYVKTWYESKNIFDPSDQGGKSIRLVRAMHERVFKLMNDTQTKDEIDERDNTREADTNKSTDGYLRVNQFDMALTQFSFIGLLILYPKKCGAHTASDQDLLDMAYIWRILGYLMGIEDRFNLCTYDNIDELREFFGLLSKKVESILGRERDPVGKAMSGGICKALQALITELDFSILDHWWRPELSLSGDDIPEPLTLIQQYKASVFSFYFNYLLKIGLLNRYVARKYKDKFEKFYTNRKKHSEELEKTKEYSQVTFE